MEREQIIKALECCGGEHPCGEECFGHDIKGISECTRILAQNALALINSQEQRIKELTEENEVRKGLNTMLNNGLRRLGEENERLRGILLQFTDIVHKWGNKNGYDTSEISLVPILNEATAIKSQIEADTVRKMQERLHVQFHDRVAYTRSYVHDTIDQIAKEMLEGENEGNFV